MKRMIGRQVFFLTCCGCCVMLTGCTSIHGEHLSAGYVALSWIGMLIGFVLSDFIWAADHPGSYVPDFQVITWLAFTALGIFLTYVRPFFLFSGFLISVFVPIIGVLIVLPFAKMIKRKHDE